jgi:hypothetical protein
MTLNPDLVFEEGAVTGDVKYKLPTKWDRGDLYQAVVFATGFKAKRACIVHFAQAEVTQPSSLPGLDVGDLKVTPFAWNFGEDIDPIDSAQALTENVTTWLEEAFAEGDEASPTFQPTLFGAA